MYTILQVEKKYTFKGRARGSIYTNVYIFMQNKGLHLFDYHRPAY